MDYAEALKAISEFQVNEENALAIVDAIKGEVNKKGTGEASVRSKLKRYEGIDPDKTREVFDTLTNFGIDIDNDITSQLETLQEKAGSADKKTSEAQKLQRQIDKLKDQWNEAKEKSQRLETEKRKSDLFSKLYPEFQKKVLNPDITLKYRIDNGFFDYDESGQVGYKKGDEVITENFLEAYLTDYKNEAKSSMASGSGSNPNGGATKPSIDIDNMSPYELAKLPREQVMAALNQ